MPPVAERYPLPSITRVVVGLILGGSLPGVLFGLLMSVFDGASRAAGLGAFLGIFYGVGPALVLGLPAVSIPLSCKGLPAGLQIIGGPFDDDLVLTVGDLMGN